jgi:hypothetical protein
MFQGALTLPVSYEISLILGFDVFEHEPLAARLE